MRRVLDTGVGARIELDFVRNGERRCFLATLEPIRGPGGVVGITRTAVDITETRRAQEELAQAVAPREQLMGVLSHDLRHPLDFTQLRFRGEMPLSSEMISLGSVAGTIIDVLRVAHPERTIDFVDQSEVRGCWDVVRLGQLVSNLVGNALTHGAADAPVQVSVSQDDQGASLVVTSRGPTIPAEERERLFEPFWQGCRDGGLTRRRLRLGLFISREIVRAHGGTIDVHSRDGGTTFTGRLPVRAASPAALVARWAASASASGAGPQGPHAATRSPPIRSRAQRYVRSCATARRGSGRRAPAPGRCAAQR